MNEFLKLETFLEFYLDEERKFTIDILRITNLIDSNFPKIIWKSNIWTGILSQMSSSLKNVVLLLENEELRKIKFPEANLQKIGLILNSPQIFSNSKTVQIEKYFQKSIKEGKVKIVKYLIENYDCNPDSHNNWAIRTACENGNLEVVKYLRERCKCDSTVNDNWVIVIASENGHLEVVKYLHKEAGCDPTVNDNWAIVMASENGHLEVVKYLHKEAGCDPTDRDNKAIQWASENGHLEVVKYLYEKAGCDYTVMYYWAVRMADTNGHIEVARYFRRKMYGT